MSRMPGETFDTARKLERIGQLTPEEKQEAREVVAVSMYDMGCTSAEIAEVFAILGILPHEEGCVCGDC